MYHAINSANHSDFNNLKLSSETFENFTSFYKEIMSKIMFFDLTITHQ